MWDEADSFYYDVSDKGQRIKVKTIASFWPLIAGVADQQSAKVLVRKLKDPGMFWRQTPFPSLAAGHLLYGPKGKYWLGGVWAPTNYMVIKGLQQHGYEEFATEAAARYLKALAAVHQRTGTLWESLRTGRLYSCNHRRGHRLV
jgi:neutral trehalase